MNKLHIWIFNSWSDPNDTLEEKVYNVMDDLNVQEIDNPGTYNIERGGWSGATSKLGINKFPAMVIMLDQPGGNSALISMAQGDPGENEIRAAILKAINNPIPKLGASDSQSPGKPIIISLGDLEDGKGVFPGFNLGLGLNLPSWAWLILAIGSGVQTLGKGNIIKKGLWGTVSVVSAINYINKQYAKSSTNG